MSEGESQNQSQNQETSILLPVSSIAVFSKDQETLGAARALEDDWRFARVGLQVDEGDIDMAIQAYAELESPDLLIIQTDTIDEAFTERLESLAENCDEGTAAVIIGPVNDVYLYRRMIDMGISDYLVRPVETPVLADVAARTLIQRIGVTGSRLIAFAGAKGGVGTSVLAQAASCGIAEYLDEKTILLDACGGRSTLSVGLGFEPSTTLLEAVRAAGSQDEDGLKRMLNKVLEKLYVLAAGGDVMLESTITAEQFEDLIDMLMIKYPAVVIDLSQAPEALEKTVISRANQINVVTTQNLVSLRQARSLIQEIKEVRGGDEDGVELIVNMQGLAPKQDVPKADIEKAMELNVSAEIPFDPQIFQSNESEGHRITEDKAGAILVKSQILPVLAGLFSGKALDEAQASGDKASGFLGGFLNKLSAGK